MGTTRDQIAGWFKEGVDQGATHLIVVCDTYDWEDYPVYVMPNQDARKVAKQHSLSAGNMQKVMEVYDLRESMMEQVYSAERVFNY